MSSASAPAAGPPADEPWCRNCGATLTGPFCSDCGQKGDVHLPSTRELLLEALEGITHSDSRLWLTLKYLVFAPGKLTTEYIAGRRATYLPPFRLYLVMSVLFFVIASLGSREPVRIVQQPVSPEQTCKDLQTDLGPSVQDHLIRACQGIVRDRGRTLLHDVLSLAPKVLFVLLPLTACFNMLLYWRPRERYVVHLLFFLHLNAFVFLVLTLTLLIARLGSALPALAGTSRVLVSAIMIYLPVYLYRALRKLFRRSIGGTLVREAVLLVTGVVTLGLATMAVFLYAAWEL